MTKTLTKELRKLKKIPHPKGRKTAQITKKAIKIAAREKVKLSHHMKTNLLGEKLLWFQQNLDTTVEAFTPDIVLSLINKYLDRFNEELEQINLKHHAGKRKGRQHANREDVINMTISHDRQEFETCGIEMPDLLNPAQLSILLKWNGELRFLQHFKLVRYSKAKLESLKMKQSKDQEVQANKEIGENAKVSKKVKAVEAKLNSDSEVLKTIMDIEMGD